MTLNAAQIARRMLKIASAAQELKEDLQAQVDDPACPSWIRSTYESAEATASQWGEDARTIYTDAARYI